MDKKLKFSALLIVLLSLSLILAVPITAAQARSLTLSEIQFDASAKGECMVQYGGIGQNGTIDPLIWNGFGEGEAKIKGIAENVDPYLQTPGYVVAYSDDIDATGGLSVSWTEEGVKYRLNVRIYSTETTEGAFLPCEERFSIPIPGAPSIDSLLEFRATYVSDSETRTFSGKALFSSGIYGQGIQGIIVVQLFDMDLNTQYLIVWSCLPLPISSPSLAAAEVFKSNIQTGEAIDYQALPAFMTSQGLGTNNRGMVVGQSQFIVGMQTGPGGPGPIFMQHAALWTEQGEVLDLGTLAGYSPGYGTSAANDVNDIGQVVGVSSGLVSGSFVSHAFLWTKKDGIVDIGTLTGHTHSIARAINNLGYIVGVSYNIVPPRSYPDIHACMWLPNGTIIALDGMIGQYEDIAYGINNLNQVVGVDRIDNTTIHAFLWTMDEGMRDLGCLPDGIMSTARGINDRGMIVGHSQTKIGIDRYGNPVFRQHAFLWTEKDGMVDLGTLPDHTNSFAYAINNLGTIVGTSGNPTSPGTPADQHACIWTKDGRKIDLSPTFPNNYPVSAALGINENGKIIGWWYTIIQQPNPPYFVNYYFAGVWDVSNRAN
jgi:probable HAF family extracellular repeat protein